MRVDLIYDSFTPTILEKNDKRPLFTPVFAGADCWDQDSENLFPKKCILLWSTTLVSCVNALKSLIFQYYWEKTQFLHLSWQLLIAGLIV